MEPQRILRLPESSFVVLVGGSWALPVAAQLVPKGAVAALLGKRSCVLVVGTEGELLLVKPVEVRLVRFLSHFLEGV